jgi:hypothetical protein
MKTLALACAVVALAPLGSGCAFHVDHRSSKAAVKSDSGGGKSCPPGHVWSDGQCHSKGKGHDK